MPVSASADTVAILGTGRMGGALGSQFARHGHTVVFGSREPGRADAIELAARTGRGASVATQAEAVARADVVVLAIPWSATEAALASLDLSGKLVIDPTNAIRPAPAGLMEMAVPTSAGELIQSWEPAARVVKAFNTVGFHIVANPALAGGPVSVPLAADDPAARAQVARLVESFGLEPVDVPDAQCAGIGGHGYSLHGALPAGARRRRLRVPSAPHRAPEGQQRRPPGRLSPARGAIRPRLRPASGADHARGCRPYRSSPTP